MTECQYHERKRRGGKPPSYANPTTDDMTMEEIEAIVAQQRQRLPRWWKLEERRMKEYAGYKFHDITQGD